LRLSRLDRFKAGVGTLSLVVGAELRSGPLEGRQLPAVFMAGGACVSASQPAKVS